MGDRSQVPAEERRLISCSRYLQKKRCSARQSPCAQVTRLLPVATTRGTGLPCTAHDGEDAGRIYLCDRPDDAACQVHLISDSLFTFLASLQWTPGTEPPAPPKSSKRRR